MGLHKVFVYGTLRRGGKYHSLLATSRALGTCVTDAAYTLLDLGGYPGLVEGGMQCVTGEVYAVDAATLAGLDALEWAPDYYDRRLMDTEFGATWVYIFLRARGDEPVIASGDWFNPDWMPPR